MTATLPERPEHPTDDRKDGPCRWCEAVGSVFADNGLCDDCDNDSFHCEVCNEERHYDHLCRHVFRDADFEWSGAGTGWEPTETVKTSFLALLSGMPDSFAPALRAAIDGGKFHTWTVAPIIGGGGNLYLRGMADDGRAWSEALLNLGADDDDGERLRDGMCWLVSLYNGETPKANATTIAWIDAYTALRTAAGESHE